ncbi:MAG: HXXEE domain-containing protein [Candidatus Margulisiibacteriota bacterium]|nr:HXXEE domain-containing protein [Candidatus Margulisiibacteriota bacterium]
MGQDWVFWAMVAGFIIHGLEEHFTAGGFLKNYNEFLIKIGRAPKSFQWLYSVMLLWALPGTVIAALIGSKMLIISLGVMWALFVNALAHLGLMVLHRKYSSGTMSGVLIFIPLMLYSYWYFMTTGQFSVADMWWSILVGGIFNIPTIPYKKLAN